MSEVTEKSKINKKEIFRILKYAAVACSAGVIQFVSSALLKLLILEHFIPKDASIFYITELNTNTFIADTVGLVLSIVWNFTLNRKYTFKAANNVPKAMALAFLFYLPFYHFQIWYIDAVEKSLAAIGDWGFIIALITCMLINGVLEFLWQQFVVFRGAVDSNVAAQSKAEQSQTTASDVSAEVAAVDCEPAETQNDSDTSD